MRTVRNRFGKLKYYKRKKHVHRKHKLFAKEMQESIRKVYIYFFLVCILAFFLSFCFKLLAVQSQKLHPIPYAEASDSFRGMAISPHNIEVIKEFAKKMGIPEMELLCIALYQEKFQLFEQSITQTQCLSYQEQWNKITEAEQKIIQEQAGYLSAIWSDIKYFPVVIPKGITQGVAFENSWMHERSYGGKRGHEGCDMLAGVNERGIYPIVSMTNGTIEKIGWLPQGGYRIGVRSESGAYFYYAHLYRYAEEFEEGSQIHAGQLLGFMGDSGYGEEGTVGKFDVHLHLGIYITTPQYEELSINPYWVLKYAENKRIEYQ